MPPLRYWPAEDDEAPAILTVPITPPPNARWRPARIGPARVVTRRSPRRDVQPTVAKLKIEGGPYAS